MSTCNTIRRGLAVAVLTLATAALGAAVAFWRAGPDMVVMTLVFGGSGIYLFIEGLGLLIVDPGRRAKPTSGEGRSSGRDKVSRAA